MILVEDVYKRYRTEHGPTDWILRGVTLTIPPKVNVGLVGGNGAGKSTLLRLIGGTDVPNRGTIQRDCRVSWPMGYSGGLQSALTGRQNATFVCRIHGHEDDIPDRIAFIKDFAELGVYFDEPVKNYSSGMRSRLNFALSMAFDFDVYISDEVTAAGDAAFRSKAKAAFKALSDHASLIMVSHGEETLRQFCTAGIWLNEGKAIWFDDINDALEAYRESWEAKAIVLPRTGARKARRQSGQLDSEENRQNHQAVDVLEKGVGGEPAAITLRRAARKARRQSGQLDSEENRQSQMALDVLKTGLDGAPATVGNEEGRRIIKAARKSGMRLVDEERLTKLGYHLKSGATPVLRKSSRASEKIIDFYELHSQCEKVDGD